MKALGLVGILLLVPLAACASSGPAASPGAAPEAQKGDSSKATEREELERALELAHARLELAKLAAAAEAEEASTKIRHAKVEVELASARLASFREAGIPNRLASERLDLQSAEERAAEAAEELAQIEIMYKDQDLDDVTAEFVVSRGRRAAERAAARIGILQAELKALEERELPHEERTLALALDRATANLAEAERAARRKELEQTIALKEAEGKVSAAESALAAQSAESDA